jgi:hypothetical protein
MLYKRYLYLNPSASTKKHNLIQRIISDLIAENTVTITYEEKIILSLETSVRDIELTADNKQYYYDPLKKK